MPDSSQMEIALMAAFCEGVARTARFTEGLRDAAEWLDCAQVSLHLWDRRGRWGCLWSVCRGPRGWECESSDQALPVQGLRSGIKKMEPDRWHWRGQPVPVWLQRITLPHAEALLSLRLRGDAGNPGASPPWQAAALVAALRPSLEPLAQAQRLAHRVANLSLVLDSLSLPMVLLDASLRIQAINDAARSWFTLGPRMTDGQIRASLPSLPGEKLDGLVRRACGLEGPAEGGMIRVPASADRVPGSEGVQVLVLPAPDGPHARRAALVLVCGRIQRQDAEDGAAIALLQHSYGLTPAEARLAQLILDGQSPGRVALQLRVSVATVRSQLSSVLRKTGASRQSDLVRRLSPLMMLNHGLHVH